jgi:hypothetical protein
LFEQIEAKIRGRLGIPIPRTIAGWSQENALRGDRPGGTIPDQSCSLGDDNLRQHLEGAE